MNWPLVTIIIGMLNEERHIQEALESILRQSYPKDRIEILAIDGGSTDRTIDLVRAYMSHCSNLHLIENPRRTLAAAMNIGIRRARGEYILKVDAHSWIAPDYVEQCVRCAERTGADLVGGPINPVGRTRLGEAIALAMSLRVGSGGAMFRRPAFEGYVDTVYLGCYRKAVFRRIGLFDERLLRTEDDELNYRIRAAGGRVYMSPKIRSKYFVRDSIGKLFKQYYEYGMWRLPAAAKHHWKFLNLRHMIPAVFVGSLGVLVAATLAWPTVAVVLATELLVYASTVLVASLMACLRAGRLRLLPWVILAILAMHFGYGLGFYRGLPLARKMFPSRVRGQSAPTA